MDKRTTKYVKGTFTLTFHGDYVSVDEIQDSIIGWLDMGLEDRDNLVAWGFQVTKIDEVEGDPEGYDH